MNVTCVGGGPGGLLLAILLRASDPAGPVRVFERNGPDDTFGFGVVFSDETLANLREADPVTFDRIEAALRSWDEIEIRYRGDTFLSRGHGFAAIERRRLLQILHHRAREVGVDVTHHAEVTDPEALRTECDLLVGADGANSAVRRRYADALQPDVNLGTSRYVWLGTDWPIDRFVFVVAGLGAGVVQAHAYPYSKTMSTLIVEASAATWGRLGLEGPADRAPTPGESDPLALAFAEVTFGAELAGHRLYGNSSRWLTFPTVTNAVWHHGNVVLLGDSAHTAHFSIGSGTKLAMEDAIALARHLTGGGPLEERLAAYEAERRPVVESTQRAADTSRQWFEGIGRYVGLPTERFAFQLLTRSQRITYDNLRRRDPEGTRYILNSWWKATPPDCRPGDPDTPPMFYPFELRGLRLPNRIAVSPMAQYSAESGLPGDWHLVHLGSRAVGGAGLIMTEMTCVAPDARITTGCTGLWNAAQQEAWRSIVDFVHRHTDARIGLQLGHAGRKGACTIPWEGADDEPLPDGWDLLAPSSIPYRPGGPVPRAMRRADMDAVRDQFVAAARRGAAAGFDLVELHFAHGYLLSSFISPLTNRRRDRYGGGLPGRLRFPLEVLQAVRDALPVDVPLAVRISATDWVPGGVDGDEAVEIARRLVAAGCDIVDVSTGQVHPDARPRYGRLYQTPFSDRIRHEVGCPTMTVGAVSSVDDVNTVLLAGRADLCLLARPHLVDPYWTLNAALDQGWSDHPWPAPYLAGRNARRRQQEAVPVGR